MPGNISVRKQLWQDESVSRSVRKQNNVDCSSGDLQQRGGGERRGEVGDRGLVGGCVCVSCVSVCVSVLVCVCVCVCVCVQH